MLSCLVDFVVWQKKEKVSWEDKQHILLKREWKERSSKSWGWRGRRWRRWWRWWPVQVQTRCKTNGCSCKLKVQLIIKHLHKVSLKKNNKKNTFFQGWRRRWWRWRPVKVRPERQRRRRQTGQEKGQPFGIVPFPLILALLQLQFTVEVQVKGYRSRVTPGKMSVSAQSSFWFTDQPSIKCPVLLICCFPSS